MIVRFLLAYLLPILLPTALYLAWAWIMAARVEAARGRGEAAEFRARTVPWTWLLAAGVLLMLLTLGGLSLREGAPPHATYEPPRLVDGQVVPGQLR
ncbi:MAG: DUF6111 family protein [Alphaproteobacteria bacterium]